MKTQKSQRGVALITALLIFALLATLGANLAWEAYLDVQYVVRNRVRSRRVPADRGYRGQTVELNGGHGRPPGAGETPLDRFLRPCSVRGGQWIGANLRPAVADLGPRLQASDQ